VAGCLVHVVVSLFFQPAESSVPIAENELMSFFSHWPILVLVAIALPLILLAWRIKAYPTWWWMGLLGFSFGLSFLVFVSSFVAIWLIVFAIVATLILTFDLLVLFVTTRQGITASRSVAKTASLGVEFPCEVTIENRTPMTLRGAVRDDLPAHFTAHPPQHSLYLPSRGLVTMRHQLMPMRRGIFDLEHVYLQLMSPARFWILHKTIDVKHRLNVYPDMKQLGDYALLARTNRLCLIGVRRTRRIGQDSDFERLRDYTPDDNYRHIDWRSTARRRKLTVRQFQSDQSQRIVFLLDCGRMMTNERDGYSLLDHALNAMLMMAYVALVQGDEVGLLCFSDQVHRYIPPQGGSSQMNRLIRASFDQFPRLVESRYDDAFLYLSNHCKRRSLVVLATSVIDEVNAAQVVGYLANLTSRHLPLGVLLRDRQMFDAADHPEGDAFNLYRAAAAADILLWRQQVITDLHHRGVLIVDAFPDELTAPLVNEYLRIKAKHLL
jgi:uncharacterized protein (DUF58 family)